MPVTLERSSTLVDYPWPEATFCTFHQHPTGPAMENMAAAQQHQQVVEPDSDPDDDPGKLLNEWLGQLDNLKKGLDSPPPPQGNKTVKENLPPVLKRRQQKTGNGDLKTQYRCSLINLEETQDDELDAILGELSVLESQFEEEIAVVDAKITKSSEDDTNTNSREEKAKSPESDNSEQSSGLHSRSSSGGSVSNGRASSEAPSSTAAAPEVKPLSANGNAKIVNGKRTDSPDNDSAFCDNLSVLSSCSNSSRSNDIKSSSGVSSSTSTPSQEEQEARIKAEKIKLAIEKIKEANVKKLFIKVFTSDGSAKSLLVDEKMSVGYVTRILAEKNHVKLDPKWTLVELIPDLYMERVYEDHENLVENCLMWKVDSKNTLWFIERPEKYDVFVRPERYLLGSSSSQKGDTMEDHSRQELLEEYFSSSGVGAPEVEGFVWLKADSKKSWKKFFFVLRSSGLYYAPKGKKTSKDLVCLATFDVNQVYYGAGWHKKYKAPTEHCFAIKHPQIQAKTPKYMRYLCVDTEKELHQWVTGIRVAKNGRQLYANYRGIEEEITHADIDILTSKRFSVNSPNTLQINGSKTQPAATSGTTTSPARTPSSENKSLDSALSSGIVSDMSNNSNAIDVVSETSDNVEVTPVNTMDRNSGNLRRSTSKVSSSSSSSGCLSDRCSSAGSHPQHPMMVNGFESDFPAGGTIKKRPSAAANPKIPLTSTTWGLVRDSDDGDSSSVGSNGENGNIRIGGGGTLLRSAVRQSLRKNSSGTLKPPNLDLPLKSGGSTPDLGQTFSQPLQVHEVQVHREQPSLASLEVDPMSQEFECVVEEEDMMPLPPPPRAESIDQHLNSATLHTRTINSQPAPDIDDLPPPPPPEAYEETNHYHVSPVQQLPPSMKPALPPPSLKPSVRGMAQPSPSRKPPPAPVTKRISFDDNVQMIDSEPQPNGIRYMFQRTPYTASPKKLFSSESQSKATPPQEFLADLKRVMTKKWQVAEKCRSDTTTSPHNVLGFRDNNIQHLVGQGHTYSKDESIGAWLLQNEQFASSDQVPLTQEEPLYAVCAKNNAQFPQQQQNQLPLHYAPRALQQYQPMPPSPPKVLPNHRPPVVLREPTPDYDPYGRINQPPQTLPVKNNYSQMPYQNGQKYPPHHMANHQSHSPTHHGNFHGQQKKAPPPPRRSVTTHLTTTS